jgi:hypothetical protein
MENNIEFVWVYTTTIDNVGLGEIKIKYSIK